MTSLPPLALAALLLPLSSLAAHFDQAFIDIRLIGADSVHLTVSADKNDMMNTVYTFPYEDNREESFRMYQARIESYLQARVPMRVDGKPVRLAAVNWKPGGRGRGDGFDSVSIRDQFHVITLGGVLPRQRKVLEIRSDMWVERDDGPPIITMEYCLFQGDVFLRQRWARTEKSVRFPVSPDSVAAMRANPPVRAPRLSMPDNEDHSGHGH
jgi:hypothetical protein